MANFSTNDIKQLREETGAGMMDVKNALTEADGDKVKAKEILRQKGAATADKKSNRVAAEGMIQAYHTADNKVAALAEVNCETDFSAKNERFQNLAAMVPQQVAEKNPANMDELMSQDCVVDSSVTVQTFLTDTVGAVKENMTIRRFERYELSGAGIIQTYIHAGGKIGVMLELNFNNDATAGNDQVQQLAKDLAMQIAAVAPDFLSRDDVPQAYIDKQTEIFMGADDVQSKPEHIRPKVVEGKVNKYIAEQVMLEQPFVKDPKKLIKDLLTEVSSAVGDTLTVKRFTRYLLGEGIEANNADEQTPATVGA